MANVKRSKIVFKCTKAHFDGWGWNEYKFPQSTDDYNAKNGVMVINEMLNGLLEWKNVALWAHYWGGVPAVTVELPVSGNAIDDPSVVIPLERLLADLHQTIKDGDIDYFTNERTAMVSLLRKYADKFEKLEAFDPTPRLVDDETDAFELAMDDNTAP